MTWILVWNKNYEKQYCIFSKESEVTYAYDGLLDDEARKSAQVFCGNEMVPVNHTTKWKKKGTKNG